MCRCLRLKQNVGSQLLNKLIDCEGDIEAACSAADVVEAQGVKIEPLQHMPCGFDERTDANGEGEGGGEGEGNQLEAEKGRRLRSTTPSGRWSVAGGQQQSPNAIQRLPHTPPEPKCRSERRANALRTHLGLDTLAKALLHHVDYALFCTLRPCCGRGITRMHLQSTWKYN